MLSLACFSRIQPIIRQYLTSYTYEFQVCFVIYKQHVPSSIDNDVRAQTAPDRPIGTNRKLKKFEWLHHRKMLRFHTFFDQMKKDVIKMVGSHLELVS